MSESTGSIVLIGMPGAGKSTLGVVLAKILNKNFVDADLVIQQQQGKTLQTLIDENGAEGFISIENEALCGLYAENAIIATGGSAVYSREAMNHLAALGPIVYLQISHESLVERLGDLEERGVVMRSEGPSDLLALYEERRPLYEGYADITVNVDGLSITNAARKTAAALTQANA